MSTSTTQSTLRARIAAEIPDLIRIRRDLHAHPEIAYQEHRTSGVVQDELKRLGIAFRAGVARGTGVVGYLPATRPTTRGAVALRADMDALPIQEQTGAEYASRTPGTMHACGHDGHTTNLLGVARVLSKMENRPNPVTLLFQPAEEGGAGADAMCKDGALDGDGSGPAGIGPPVRQVFGLHGWPQYHVGIVGSRPGPLLASTDNFTITIRGTQAHAAYPQFGRDPIVAMSHIIVALQTIVSRNTSPFDSVVVTIAVAQAGMAHNVIPETASFTGTLRTLEARTRLASRERIFSLSQNIAAGFDCRAEINWVEGYPVTRNDPTMTAKFDRIARRTLGDDRVVAVESPTMGGEDFSYYGLRVPACFFILGVRPLDRPTYPTLHQPTYDFNDDALATGIDTMCALALDEQDS